MPTITVETDRDSTVLRRRCAKAWSLWLRSEGIDINHVLVRFAPLAEDQVFSGPFPLGNAHGPGFALVRCVIAEDRSPEFQAALAAQITAALEPEVAPERTFVQFEPVDPRTHFVGAPRSRPQKGHPSDAHV